MVELRLGGTAANITVSNPGKLNVVNTELLDQLIEACNEISAVSDLRVVVLAGGETAAGKAPSFIGGADITVSGPR